MKRMTTALMLVLAALCFVAGAGEEDEADEEVMEAELEELEARIEELERRKEELEEAEDQKEEFAEIRAEAKERLADIKEMLADLEEEEDDEEELSRAARTFNKIARKHIEATRKIVKDILAIKDVASFDKVAALQEQLDLMELEWEMLLEPKYGRPVELEEMTDFVREEAATDTLRANLKRLKELHKQDLPNRELEFKLCTARMKREQEMEKLLEAFWEEAEEFEEDDDDDEDEEEDEEDDEDEEGAIEEEEGVF